MKNSLGRIRATPLAGDTKPAAATAESATPAADGDNALPDPTAFARWWLAGLIAASLAAALILNAADATSTAFKPAAVATANFALFAGFYVAAQIIERLMELIAPLLPCWRMPPDLTDPKVKAAQIKADRAKVTLGIATLAGVILSCLLGLFFLSAIGMQVSHTVDAFFTGLVIAAGTKPLHDFITLLQNKNSPTTGTTGS